MLDVHVDLVGGLERPDGDSRAVQDHGAELPGTVPGGSNGANGLRAGGAGEGSGKGLGAHIA